ncbi:MFS transporter [Brevibacillus composti]|uniref:MFS transporter n=1 Tax=Brevibacillus composti TaxID=2796470 RepID=A0A7T5JPG8_9BACL|nr:MFS transporter [Brevibacillus composti]QQE75076.1 MFS transporter [Brevibacillus composti]QUO42162.1 MFS transporter [Brevibacillus composti]
MSSGKQGRPPLRLLLTHRKYLQWSAAVQLMRMPSIMTSFSFVLVGGNKVGGLMITAYILCSTFFAIPGGRLIDRMGIKKGAPLFLLLAAAVLSGIAIAAAIEGEGAHGLFIPLAGLTGALLGGIPGGMRSLLSRTVPPQLLPSAIAFDATVIELVVVSAPLIAAAAAMFWVPGAVLAMSAAAAIASFLTWRLAALGEPEGRISAAGSLDSQSSADGKPQSPWSDQSGDQADEQGSGPHAKKKPASTGAFWWLQRRFVFWILLSIAFGHALGTAEVGALPIVQQSGGSSGAAAALIAVLAVSSAASGLAYAFFSHHIRLSEKLQACLLLFCTALGCFLFALSTHWVTLALSMIVIGVCTAPLMTVRSLAAEKEMPDERKAEGFSIMNVSHTIGFALGGFFLSILPLPWMVAAGGLSGLLVLLSALFLLPRPSGRQEPSRSEASYSEVP